MGKLRYLIAALAYTGCPGFGSASNANAADTAKYTAATASEKDAIMTLEKNAYEAWRSKDDKFWDTFLSDKFVGYSSSGKLNKASAKKEYTGAACDIKSFSLADQRTKPLGHDVALITYKSTIDGSCEGHRLPANSWAASVYVREGDHWKGAFHAASPVVDPAAAAVKSVASNGTSEASATKPIARDAATRAMLAVEIAVWEDWRAHDAKKIAGLTTRDISFINIFGVYLASKADALKNWSGAGCDAKSVSVTDAAATMLSPTVGILTFKGAAEGSCYGQAIGPIWGTSIYVKEGNVWRWTFGINTPASGEGA